jgi:5-(carboxyamino)imidazole ribonucleotide mutase
MSEPYKPNYKFGHHLKPVFAAKVSRGIIGVIMGSQSDWPFVHPCTDMLEKLEIPFEFGVVSAHRTAERMMQYAHAAADRKLKIIIACAGGSAHLPGMVASELLLPTFGIAPKKDDVHAVGSMIAMPEGKPLGYMGGGSGPGRNAGAVNAALMAARILALNDSDIRARLAEYDRKLRDGVPFTSY